MFKTLTALYVEDESVIQESVNSVLSLLFNKLLLAQNGQMGLDVFLENKDNIDLIITDINMPKLDGIEMAKRIREVNSDVPIIITTAYNDNKFLHEAISLGISSFLVKPLNLRNMVKVIEQTVKPILLKKELEEEQKKNISKKLKLVQYDAIHQLSAGLTHEINTPLTSIKANKEMLSYDIETVENERDRASMFDSLEKIDDGVKRIESLINTMRELYCPIEIKIEKANIYNSILRAVYQGYNKTKYISEIFINGEKYNTDIKEDNQEFIANVQLSRVEQVWVIVINNAIDELMKIERFEDRRLDINIKQTQDFIEIRFKDNAGGIKEEVMDKLYEPFKRTKESSGIGIGLSIAKKIIDEQPNGSIEAYNEDNGAVFCIKLGK